MTIYLIKEVIDEDGGYGDAVYTEQTVAAFAKREDAEAFISDFHDPYTYDTPYDELQCQAFFIETMEVEENYDKSEWKYERQERRRPGILYHNDIEV